MLWRVNNETRLRNKRVIVERRFPVKSILNVTLTLIAILFSAVASFAQGDTLSGKYEGTAKVAGSADTQISLELKNEGGKISGHLMNGQTSIEISEGTLVEGKLSLKLGAAAKDGVLTAKVEGDKLTGEWVAGTQKKTIELKKAAATTAAAAPFNLSGQWEGVADANGQPFPFLLTLKVEGEKVTGGSSSQLGDSNISTGSWKDGKLYFQLEGSNGVTTMSAVVIEGKLSGEFDYAGQLQGKWVAVKKN
jgi:hypothetical protein